MTALTEATRNEIHRRFWREYQQKTLEQQTGFIGTVARANASLERWHRNNLGKSLLLIAGLVLTSLAVVATFFGVAGVILGASLTFGASVGIDMYNSGAFKNSTYAKTKKAIDADIDNGTLQHRYKTEVVEPELARLERVRQSLPDAGDLAKRFGASVSPVAGSVDIPLPMSAPKASKLKG